jgi:hypothetical protein
LSGSNWRRLPYSPENVKLSVSPGRAGGLLMIITPFLWFDDRAEEVVKFYPSIFKNLKIKSVTRYGEEGAKAAGRQRGRS